MIIRVAKKGDAKGIAKVQVDSWRTTYQGIVSDEFLASLSYEKREEVWNGVIEREGLLLVAENNDGEIVGFISGGKERSGEYPQFTGELYAIYIFKEYQKLGVGKKLVKAFVQEMLDKNYNSMLVLVLAENPARFFYEKLGGKYVDTTEIEIGGEKLEELIYGWEDISVILEK